MQPPEDVNDHWIIEWWGRPTGFTRNGNHFKWRWMPVHRKGDQVRSFVEATEELRRLNAERLKSRLTFPTRPPFQSPLRLRNITTGAIIVSP